MRFHHDKEGFKRAEYSDTKTVEFYMHFDPEFFFQSEQDKQIIKNFFIQTQHYNPQMGDIYHIGQAGAAGPGASASNNTFSQYQGSLPADTDYLKLSQELEALKAHLVTIAKGAGQWTAIGALESAEEAAKEKDGNKVLKALATAGKWVFDTATEIGVDLAAEVIKKSMGL